MFNIQFSTENSTCRWIHSKNLTENAVWPTVFIYKKSLYLCTVHLFSSFFSHQLHFFSWESRLDDFCDLDFFLLTSKNLFFRGLFIHFKLKSISFFFCLNIHLFFDRGLISIFALTKKDACKTVVVLVLLVICKRLKCIWNTDLYFKKEKKWEKLICFFSFILKIFHPEAIFEFMRENSIIHFFKASFFSAKIQKTDFAICHQMARKFKVDFFPIWIEF